MGKIEFRSAFYQEGCGADGCGGSSIVTAGVLLTPCPEAVRLGFVP